MMINFQIPSSPPLSPLEYDKFFRSGRKDKDRSTGVRESAVQLSLCQPHSLHPFPSDKDKNILGEMAKRRGSTNKKKTFNLDCFDYCTHDKLQEWPPLPLPQKKGEFFEKGGIFSADSGGKNYPHPKKICIKWESVMVLYQSNVWNQAFSEAIRP